MKRALPTYLPTPSHKGQIDVSRGNVSMGAAHNLYDLIKEAYSVYMIFFNVK